MPRLIFVDLETCTLEKNEIMDHTENTHYPILASCLFESVLHGNFSRFTTALDHFELTEAQSGVVSSVFQLDYLDKNIPNLIRTRSSSKRHSGSFIDKLHYSLENPKVELQCLEENRLDYENYLQMLQQFRPHLTAELLDNPVTKLIMFFVNERFRGARFLAHAGDQTKNNKRFFIALLFP